MTINPVNATWKTSGPQFTFQQTALGGRDASELAYRGYFTFGGDNTSSLVTVNYIDGTQTPFWSQGNPPTAVAPSAILVGPINQVNGVQAQASAINTVFNIGTVNFNVQFSGLLYTNTQYNVPFIVFPY
jgi:hypothetical protein